MDRRIARLVLRWLRNALVLWAAVLLVAIVALGEPYFSHGLAIGYGPVRAFRWLVVPSLRYSVGFWNHVVVFGLTVVSILVIDRVRRSKGLADDDREDR